MKDREIPELMGEKRPLKVVAPEQNYNLQYYQDEISLTDVWIFIYRNWRTIYPIFLICLATGITAAILWPTEYSVSTTIKVGLRDMNKGGQVTIEPMGTVRTKLEKAFIPLAIKEQKAKFGYDGGIKTDVDNPGGTLIQIQLSGNDLGGERLLSLMQVVIGKLINEHEQLIEPLKKELIAEKKIAIRMLKQLEDYRKILFKKDRTPIELKLDVGENRLLMETQQDIISKTNLKLAGLGMTEVLVPPASEQNNAYSTRIAIVLLSIVLGVILGGGIAILSESMKKAKILIQESKS